LSALLHGSVLHADNVVVISHSFIKTIGNHVLNCLIQNTIHWFIVIDFTLFSL
jgi:hypothetical protein